MPLEALETLHMGTLSRDELESLQHHARYQVMMMECDDYAHSKGLSPFISRWRIVQSKARREMETRFEGEGV
jgi:hypothetical protein